MVCVGQPAATARRIRYSLLPRLGKDLTVAVVLAGVNDVLTRRTPQEWGDDLTAIVEEVTGCAERVGVTGIPPFDAFLAMPSVLGRYLTERAAALDEVSRRICEAQPRATWIGAPALLPVGPELFARDHFHPSAFGYRRWAGAGAGAEHVTP